MERARARERQLLAQYASTIQNAFKDTLDALVAQRKARETYEAEQNRVNALESSYKLAQMRYDNGVSSLLDVLDVERGLLDAELNRIEAQRASSLPPPTCSRHWAAAGVVCAIPAMQQKTENLVFRLRRRRRNDDSVSAGRVA